MADTAGQATASEWLDPHINSHSDNHTPSLCRGSNGHAEEEVVHEEADEEHAMRRMQSYESDMDEPGQVEQAEFEVAGDVCNGTKAVQAHDQQQAEASSINPSTAEGLQHRAPASEADIRDVVVPLPLEVLVSGETASQDKAVGFDTMPSEPPLVQGGECTDATRARQRLAAALARTSVMSVSEVPKGTVRASKILAGNAILMAAVEIVIEVLVLAEVFPKLPFRLDFFFLTILSGLLGFHVVRGLAQDHFDTSMNALQVSGLVEIALTAGDIKFMVEEGSKYSAAVPTRAAFAVLTCINLVLVLYLAVRLLKYHRAKRRSPLLASVSK